jgi:hypothetical protein
LGAHTGAELREYFQISQTDENGRPSGNRVGIRSRGQYFMQYDGNAGGVSEYRRSRRARILRAPSRRAAER